MRNRPFPILGALALAISFSASTALGHDENRPHVSVSGVATTEAKPEVMIWRLTAQNRGEDLEEVAKSHQSLSKSVLTTIKSFGVEEDAISSERMTFGENWEYEQGRRFRNGFFASSQIIFRSDKLEQYDIMWQAFAKLPEVQVQNVAFDLKPETSIRLRRDMRREALLSAREKARDMAETLGSSIAHPRTIEDLSGDVDHFQPQAKAAGRVMSLEMADGGGPSVNPGMIEIRARVQVTFDLVQ